MNKIDTVIFDMDGTVLYTLEDLCDSVNHTMTLFGFPARTLDEVRAFVGNGVGRLIELSVPDGIVNPAYNRCLDEFKRHYEANMRNKTRPYDGIPELLAALKQQGYKLAIVSNKFDAAVKGLARFYFRDAIDIAVGESAGVAKKPAPDTVFKALEALGADTGHAVYVGDSEVDAETARNAALPFVAVTWGFRDRELLESKNPQWIIDKPVELLGILEHV
jgi:phosphoglycolate phosphatase